MASTADVTDAEDGPANVKLHPYLVTLVRWCVSCLWSTATVLLHRIMMAPLQPITGPRSSKPKLLKRAAGTEHLHPEPRVECQILHHPETHTLDVIFVHGLYGSLGNTWRQGEWKPKYEKDPKKVTLREHSEKTCKCQKNTSPRIHIDGENNNDRVGCKTEKKYNFESEKTYNYGSEKKYNYESKNTCKPEEYTTDLHDTEMTIYKVNEKLFKKIIPKENDLITEQFYNNTLLDQVEIIDNYDTQASFVRDLFKRENNETCDNINKSKDKNCKNECSIKECKCADRSEVSQDSCKCSDKKCEVGCGCICDDCYSTCWPKDWIKEDFPGARVISVNYTSDPYLWRPLWIKENKRLSLHVRADQMIDQLLALKVGERPIVWVGHSKGGLFIKQIYCEAFDAYKKLHKTPTPIPELKKNTDFLRRVNSTNNDAVLAETIESIVSNMFDKQILKQNDNIMTFSDYREQSIRNEMGTKYNAIGTNTDQETILNGRSEDSKDSLSVNCKECDSNGNIKELCCDVLSSSIEEGDVMRARLYERSRAFMFYSVPHRGSPLADIKTPVTARSLELLEISKDCPLVLDLHARWLEASAARRAGVRGFVETCRTLMSVLWLTIVSEQSADAGIGTLLGVSVDHREICKPSSRHCMLYTELVDLINGALRSCDC